MRLSLRGNFTAFHRPRSPYVLPRRNLWSPLVSRTDYNVRTLVNRAAQSGLVEVRTVVLRRRIFTWKRILTTALTTGLVFSSGLLAFSLLFYPLDDDEDFDNDTADIPTWNDEEEGGDQHDQAGDSGIQRGDMEAASAPGASADDGTFELEEADVDAIQQGWFIPLGRFELLPQEYYRADDPVWQALIQFNGDHARRANVKNKLTGALLTVLISNESRRLMLGDNPKCTLRWLYEDYPRGPPRKWRQYGLELTPDHIALTYRIRKDVDVARTIDAILPTKVASSAVGAFWIIFDGHYNKFKQAWASLAREKSPHQSDSPSSIQAAGSSMVSKPDGLSIRPIPDPTRPVGTGKPSVEQDRSEGVVPLPFRPPSSNVIADAIQQFKRDLARKWNRKTEIPSGTVLLRGTVQYSGSRGFCILDVVALYSVTDNRIIRVEAAIRQMKTYRQKRDPNR